MKDCKCNSGVCCDVCTCTHNVDGCKCALGEIKVTTGDTQAAHFCKSFCNKNKCK